MPDPLHVADGHDRRAATAADLHPGPRRLPAADADLHQVGRRRVLDVGGVEPRRGVHPLVQVELLGVHVPVEVDDPDVAVEVRREPPDRRVADRMVAAQHDREDAVGDDVTHRLADLVERLLQVARDRADVADVDQVQLLAEIDPHLEVVGAEQVRRPPDALRAEPGARPVRRAGVQRRAEDRHLGVADVVHILDVRALHEGAPLAGEVRDLAAGEGRQGPVGDRVGRLQAVREPALDLLLVAPVRQQRLGLLGPVSFAIDAVLIILGHSGPSSRRGAFFRSFHPRHAA